MCKINHMEMLHGFDPVFDENSKILILGSFPSVLSRETSFYYGNPRNRFWKLIAKIANDIEPTTNEDKRAFLLRHNIALWDILMECEIKGSADSSIKGYEVADLSIVLSKANIEKIFLNGKKSYEVFCKRYPELIKIAVYLPSTSPANVSFDEKIWLESLKRINMRALDLVHDTIKKYIKPGDICIDATMGRGYDTSYLSELVGEKGKVISFDIQQSALDSTRQLLKDRGQSNCELLLDSHENMSKYVEEDSVSCILFNLGYLPSGNHNIYTHAKSTIKAIEAGLKLLKKDGIMCVSIYYGGDSGYEERDELLPYLRNMDDGKYQVIMASFYNWKNDPPIPVFITKV